MMFELKAAVGNSLYSRASHTAWFGTATIKGVTLVRGETYLWQVKDPIHHGQKLGLAPMPVEWSLTARMAPKPCLWGFTHGKTKYTVR